MGLGFRVLRFRVVGSTHLTGAFSESSMYNPWGETPASFL